MSRTQQQGIDYFPFAVDFFSDKKVKILKARYGADGLIIYQYLLCTIYREGYYTRVDDDFLFIISDELNIKAETVEQVLTFLVKRSMFDEQLFNSDAILTSHGIQERWQYAVKTRAAKTPMRVDSYWLLSKEETLPCIKPTIFSDNSEKKDDNSEKKDDNSENYPQSKVKKSKVNNIPPKSPQGEAEESFKGKFLSLYPKLKACKNYDDSGVDYKILLDRFSTSTRLRQTYSMKWVCENYEAIQEGVFTDTESGVDQMAERERWYASRKNQAEAVAERFEKRALQNAEYKKITADLSQAEREAAKAEAFNLGTLPTLLHNIEHLREKRISILNSMGIRESDLIPQYHCKKCSDSGFMPDGRACDCYKKE